MAVTFKTRRMVQFADTDMAGIAHFTNYLRYMEEAEHEYFRSLGLNVMHREPDGSMVSWPRVAAECSFLAPAYYDDIIEIRLNISNMGEKSLTFDFEFRRDDTVLARGKIKTVCCLIRHGEKMRSMVIPDRYREKMAPAETEDSGIRNQDLVHEP